MGNDGAIMDISELFVSEEANELDRISLDGQFVRIGKKEVSLDGQWIDIYSTESDTFKNTVLELSRKAASGKASADEVTHGPMACLIAAWSFNTPCTTENKVNAVKQWPQALIKYIDKRASGRVSFFTKEASS